MSGTRSSAILLALRGLRIRVSPGALAVTSYRLHCYTFARDHFFLHDIVAVVSQVN
jgi:hypothetical protein